MTPLKPKGLGILLGALGLILGAASIPSAMADAAHNAQSAPADSLITGGQIGAPTKTPTAGDVWGTTWADDGNLYSIGDDAQGWPIGAGLQQQLPHREGDWLDADGGHCAATDGHECQLHVRLRGGGRPIPQRGRR